MLLVLIDDAGFGNPSTFGGPIDTPNYTRMAEEGLRYNRFHVTAVCSPTRAAMLTGRNQHRVGFGLVAEFSGPFPGYNATIPRDCATLPRILQENGYMTSAIGKWHLTPDNQQGSAGPSTAGRPGSGSTTTGASSAARRASTTPLITENQKVQGVPEGKDGKPYYFPDDMAEKAIDWLHRVRAERPERALVHVLRDRVQPRAAPRAAGVVGQVQGQVRPGLGRRSARRRWRARRSSASFPPTRSCRRTTRSRSGTP